MSFILHRIHYTRVVVEDATIVMIGIIIAILLNRVALNGIIMTHLLQKAMELFWAIRVAVL